MWADPDGLDVLDPLDEVVLAQLGDVLRPAAIVDEPCPAESAALHVAVASRFAGRNAPGVTVLHRRRVRPGRARSAWRIGSAAAAVVAFSASAAAATVGVPLPPPVRAVAYAVGLPVDSPALDDTHRHLRALDEALDEGDRPEVRRRARNLEDAVALVPADERRDIEDDVAAALAAAAPLLGESQSETDPVEDPASVPSETTSSAANPQPRPSSTTANDTESRARPTTPTTVHPYPSATMTTVAEGSVTSSADAPGTDVDTGSAAPPDGDEPSDDRSASSPVAPDPEADPTQSGRSDPSPREEQVPPDNNPDDEGDPQAS
ncbi:MAG: hypothetical protein M3357_14140 [Actinomycetota bacterium]|nr:hypothetical protein [Actinomycetota bacterium]